MKRVRRVAYLMTNAKKNTNFKILLKET